MARDPYLNKVALLSNFDAAPADLTFDPYWANVTLLVHGNGTAGAYSFTDSSPAPVSNYYGGGTRQLVSGLGYSRSCIWFNGGYVYYSGGTGHTFGTGAFTIELRVRPSVLGGTLIDWRPTGTDGLYPAIESWADGSVSFHMNTDVSIYSPPGALKVGVWSHVAVSRTGGTVRLFVDGALVASAADTNNYLLGASRPVLGAVGYNTAALRFYGHMEEVRVTKGVGRYTAAFTPPSRPFNHGVHTTAVQDTLDAAYDTEDIVLAPFGNAALSTTQSRTGGKSLYLDGSSWVRGDGIDFGASDFTLEGWFFLPAPVSAASQMLLTVANTASTQFANLYVDADGTLMLIARGSSDANNVWVSGRTVLTASTWHHVAVVREGNNLYALLDGAIAAAATMTGTLTTDNVAVGINALNTALDRLTGYVDGWRITKGLARYKASSVDPYLANVALHIPSATLTRCVPPYASKKAVTNTNVVAQSVTTPFGSAGYAAQFNGTTSNIGIASSDFAFGTGDFTVEAWVYITGDSAVNASSVRDAAVFLVGTSGGYSFDFGVAGSNSATGAGVWCSNGAGSGAFGNTPVPKNQWVHIAAARQGGVLRLFQDGVKTKEVANVASMGASNTAFVGGGPVTNYADYLAGRITDVRVTKGVARYTTNFTPPTNYALVADGAYAVPSDSFPAAATYVSGIVYGDTGAPAARRVYAYSRATGTLLASTTSDGSTGAFYMAVAEEVFVVCLDQDGGSKNALIFDRLAPYAG